MEYTVYHLYKEGAQYQLKLNSLHMLPTTSSITSLDHWLLFKVLTFTIYQYMTLLFNFIQLLLYCKCFFMYNNHTPLYVRCRCLPPKHFNYM